MIRQVVSRTSAVTAVAAAGCLLLIMFGVGASVILRKLTGAEIPGIVEVGEMILVGGAYLGLAWTYKTGGHVSVDLVTERLRAPARSLVTGVSTLLLLFVLGWLMYSTSVSAWGSFVAGEYRYGTIQVLVWPVRILIPLGILAMAAEVVIRLVDVAAEWRGTGTAKDDPDSVGLDTHSA